jgi:hypothetical protein
LPVIIYWRVKMTLGQAENCSEECDNYQGCLDEGMLDRFVQGAMCSDFFKEDAEE